MARVLAQALEALPWDQLESTDPEVPAKELRRVLRRLFRKGPESTENDCHTLFYALAHPVRGVPSATPAALPFVVALAADPGTGARTTLVELLIHLAKTADQAEPRLVAQGWADAWDEAHDTVQALLADADPVVRRTAVPLADGPGRLVERWRSERDLSVRLPVLFALGWGAPEGGEVTAEVRAVLDEALRSDDRLVWLAAVHALARLDPELPARERKPLVAVLTDPALRSRWEEVWYLPDAEYPYDRKDVAVWTAELFEDRSALGIEFLTRLAAAADPAEDTDLLVGVLDRAWRLLTRRRSVEPALLPLAAALLDHPDPELRYRAAHLLALLGPRAAGHADRLAALLDDPGEAEADCLEGTVGEHARWALARMGDPRALDGLVDVLCAPYRDGYGRGYTLGDPRRPEIEDVLTPLRAHTDAVLPSIREELRQALADPAGYGPPTADFLAVLRAWETDALPALPEVTAFVADDFRWYDAMQTLAAMGPGAHAAAPALIERIARERPGNRHVLHWALQRIGGGDLAENLRAVGEALPPEAEAAGAGMVGYLADFGTEATPYAERVGHMVDHSTGWVRVQAASALWAITGEPEPARSVLTEPIVALAAGGDEFGSFQDALRALLRHGCLDETARNALLDLRAQDRRLSPHGDYRAILQDEGYRALIDAALAGVARRDRG
ncbi:MAG: hypothetical protein HOV82_16550 [Streptomyces sp.]|nr:hypothetical protein [Streptomyces sp.]NUS13616.1 hypothetical protein [Streptomyces sp.]NUS31391.1 hypothetical protein [Streptomyces sp.]NUS76233.1 hypothetical protein [Streptomyces sp.]